MDGKKTGYWMDRRDGHYTVMYDQFDEVLDDYGVFSSPEKLIENVKQDCLASINRNIAAISRLKNNLAEQEEAARHPVKRETEPVMSDAPMYTNLFGRVTTAQPISSDRGFYTTAEDELTPASAWSDGDDTIPFPGCDCDDCMAYYERHPNENL